MAGGTAAWQNCHHRLELARWHHGMDDITTEGTQNAQTPAGAGDAE